MTSQNNDLFYSRLPVNQIGLSDLLTEDHLFFTIPSNWHVVITDVKKSTQAVQNGLHETVNLVATGSIVAVLNIAMKKNITVPYFFGGDGATFIIPYSILEETITALSIHQKNTSDNYNIHLRVGHVPVENIYKTGQQLRISKLQSAEQFSIPIILGAGLAFAEKVIKSNDTEIAITGIENDILDLSGMQCRWDKIKPPERMDEVVSLVVIVNGTNQAAIFKKVIDKIDQIYGQPQERKPISVPRLKLKATIKKISDEMKVKMGGKRPLLILKNWFTTLLGTLYFKTKPGKNYLIQLVDFSDTLVMDGKINTVISGTSKQRELLEAALNEMEEQREIQYGMFVSKESVMSCYVRSMDKNHVHFVDGSDGGYTKAAGVLKKKLALN